MRQRKALTGEVKKRYHGSSKKKKTKILNEFVLTTKYNRSYARRLFNQKKKRIPKRKLIKLSKQRFYDKEVFVHLKKIWVIADCICGKRLKPFMPEFIQKLIDFKEIKINKKIKKKLLTISSSTIDRILSNSKRQLLLRKGRSTTRPGTLLRNMIPVRTFSDWNEERPGFFEADLVALCGDTVRGEYVNVLDMTDVAVAWELLEAFMGKAQARVHKAIDEARNRLPFPMLGLDNDNGTEFINWILKRYCDTNKITFTRIRPYRKNDNCFVEQKNYTVPRRFLGYSRFETEEQLLIIKEILKRVELYVNFFQPSMKQIEKHREGAKVKKKFDESKTPYRRLLKFDLLSKENKHKLEKLYGSLNPAELKRQICALQTKLFKTLRYKIIDATNT